MNKSTETSHSIAYTIIISSTVAIHNAVVFVPGYLKTTMGIYSSLSRGLLFYYIHFRLFLLSEEAFNQGIIDLYLLFIKARAIPLRLNRSW